MSNATQLQYPSRNIETYGRIGRRVDRPRAVPAGFLTAGANDPDFNDPASGAGTDAASTLHTLAASGFAATALTRSGRYQHLSSEALDAAARSHRAAGLAAVQRAIFNSVIDGLKRWLARMRERRQARATRLALWALDEHTLRDIGLARCEIPSLAQEIEDPAATRVFAVLSHRSR